MQKVQKVQKVEKAEKVENTPEYYTMDERVRTCISMKNRLMLAFKYVNISRSVEEVLKRCVQYEKWCYITSTNKQDYMKKVVSKINDVTNKIIIKKRCETAIKILADSNVIIPLPVRKNRSVNINIQAPKDQNTVKLSKRLVLARIIRKK